MQQLLLRAEDLGLRVIERPGRTRGGFDPATGTIRLAPGMSRRTARSVLAHELGHAHLGHRPTEVPHTRERQERAADEWAARLLLTPQAYAAAERARGAHLASLAFELDVTVEIVVAFQRLLRQGTTATRAA
ncbi:MULTISPECIES: ImmA/IrrE family metallo-endopeptidase [Microbacterium]|uniref:ImmA/IrrE family metallo-endopeptidase n=1 Tax=Microbacterium sufflavum TaxID=2851649 RepID=A0ABY4ILA7_9MICO|nr:MULTISPECIES: ImmA/IrrE family metallo-endopeptidase [Microbacterium]MBN6192515.1 ImmA/IrrE family metallo-endopeptidase [Aneurinibacillus sp. BA2021]MCK2028018.1 ImmA/IrrE family metallo-endopeptidase [Microbacterium sufflavum]UPL12726.1 ImmA/IrrE family metallo-endopeptidase [Microbacterium sufflavum]